MPARQFQLEQFGQAKLKASLTMGLNRGLNQTEAERRRKNQHWTQQNGGVDGRIEQPAQPAKEPARSRKAGSGLLSNLALLTIGSLVTVGLLLTWRTGGEVFGRLWATLKVSEPPAKVDLRSLVVQQVRGASELTTAVYSMESVVPASRERKLGDYVIGKTTLLYIAHGEVRAGVDLAALQPSDVQVVGESVTVRLPPPQILDSKIDVNRSKVYDYDRGFMGLGPDVAPELQELAQRETLGKVVEAACLDGILQTANERAKLTVAQLLGTAGYAQLTVQTQAATSCQVPIAQTPAAQTSDLPPSDRPGVLPSPAVSSPALP